MPPIPWWRDRLRRAGLQGRRPEGEVAAALDAPTEHALFDRLTTPMPRGRRPPPVSRRLSVPWSTFSRSDGADDSKRRQGAKVVD